VCYCRSVGREAGGGLVRLLTGVEGRRMGRGKKGSEWRGCRRETGRTVVNSSARSAR